MEVFLRGVYDKLLVACDWTQVADAPVDKQAWATYRESLRNFPETWVPSEVVIFPDTPSST
jgi:hypothetical protein